ncbi:MAG: TIR domain-containing protein [Gemmatimonadaceae bacterium]
MTVEPYDVFFSYNHLDKAQVRRIVKELERHNVRVWLDDPHLVAGDSIVGKLSEGIERSRVYAVCVGGAGFGNWHMEEVGVLVMRRVEKGQRVIPVLLPDIENPDKPGLPPLLSTAKTHRIERPPAFSKSVEVLASIIMASKPGSAPTPPSGPKSSGAPRNLDGSGDAIAEVIDVLFGSVKRTGTLTFFLGSGSSQPGPNSPPPPYEIAQHLLSELDFIGAKCPELIPPLEAASSYYAVKKSGPALENKVVELIIKRSKCEPLLHKRLASVIGQLAQIRAEVHRRRPGRTPQLIVTTSIDLMCERALLKAGLSFTRIVQHRTGKKITKNAYREVELVGDSVRLADQKGNMETVTSDDSAELDRVIQTSGSEDIHSVGDNVQPIRGLDLSGSDLVLYKYHGSHDVPKSCALSTEHYLRLAVTPYVPDKIKEILGNSPAVFLLCGILDADVRHACHTLLPGTSDNDGDAYERVAVVRPPSNPEADSYRKLEISMWANAKEALRSQTGIRVLEADPAQFLNRFLDRFEEASSATH